MDDLTMWRERAEAAEAEVRMLWGSTFPRSMVDAADVYSLAVRLVSIAGLYSDEAIGRALRMLRETAVRADEEDAAAMHNIIRTIERRAWPEKWHAAIACDHAALDAEHE